MLRARIVPHSRLVMLRHPFLPRPHGPLTPPRSPVIHEMSSPPSTNDVVRLSQLAWTTGRSFYQARKSNKDATLPIEFINVEEELSRLARALKALSETASAWLAAEDLSKDSLGVILGSCRKSLADLNYLTENYQTSRHTKSATGTSVERVWDSTFLTNYHAINWTSEGGTIQELHEMLRMHTSTIMMLRSLQDRYNILLSR